MSPEQVTGQQHDAAGDVFALAGVLVFAVTGRAPFGSGQSADPLYRVRYAEADLREVPAPLVPLFAQCLAEEPEKRPSVAELAAQLHDGRGEFTEHPPDALLAEIGRRAADIWRIVPQRLPAPAVEESAVAVTAVAGRRPSRRGFLAVGGAFAVTVTVTVTVTAAVGGVWWYRGSGGSPARKSPRRHAISTRCGSTKAATAAAIVVAATATAASTSWVGGCSCLTRPTARSGCRSTRPPNASIRDPSTGRLQRNVVITTNWWQTAVQDGQLYLLGHDPVRPTESIAIDTWNETPGVRAADFCQLRRRHARARAEPTPVRLTPHRVPGGGSGASPGRQRLFARADLYPARRRPQDRPDAVDAAVAATGKKELEVELPRRKGRRRVPGDPPDSGRVADAPRRTGRAQRSRPVGQAVQRQRARRAPERVGRRRQLPLPRGFSAPGAAPDRRDTGVGHRARADLRTADAQERRAVHHQFGHRASGIGLTAVDVARGTVLWREVPPRLNRRTPSGDRSPAPVTRTTRTGCN
ncbi:hypothetical protein ACFWP5_37470 [Streptomyces sp. NPDC058469]|uniref:hypothetical protein n=1 Tax=Streptomyces sp. NPDC058469 TaxID=3346514 RepID=UPI00366138A0